MDRLANNATQVTVYTPINIYYLNQFINIDFFDIIIITTQCSNINVNIYI